VGRPQKPHRFDLFLFKTVGKPSKQKTSDGSIERLFIPIGRGITEGFMELFALLCLFHVFVV